MITGNHLSTQAASPIQIIPMPQHLYTHVSSIEIKKKSYQSLMHL